MEVKIVLIVDCVLKLYHGSPLHLRWSFCVWWFCAWLFWSYINMYILRHPWNSPIIAFCPARCNLAELNASCIVLCSLRSLSRFALFNALWRGPYPFELLNSFFSFGDHDASRSSIFAAELKGSVSFAVANKALSTSPLIDSAQLLG